MQKTLATILSAITLLLSACQPTPTTEFRPLWDGESLEGWQVLGGGEWHIQDGILIGTNTADEPRHGHLTTNDQYGDFTIRVVYKAVAENSGLYFRTEILEEDEVVGIKGFQAEIDAEVDAGGLYETYGREWVIQPDSAFVASFFKPGDWNEMTVHAEGRNVTVHVNGIKTAELDDDPGRTTGYIALQLHGSQDMEVQFKSIEIKGESL